MDDSAITFHLHRLSKAKRSQRVNKARRAIFGVRAIGQKHAHRGWQGAIFGIDGTANQGDGLADQGLRFRRGSRSHHGAAAFIADGKCFIHAACHGPHSWRRHIHGKARLAIALPCPHR